MTRSRYNELTKNMALCHTLRSHPDFMVVEDRSIDTFLQRLEPSMFVFGPEDAAQMLIPELDKHVAVTDILGADTIHQYAAQNRALLDRCDRLLINAATDVTRFSKLFDGRENIGLNPFCPIAQPPGAFAQRDSILFASSPPSDPPNVSFLNEMAELVDQRPDLKFVFISPFAPLNDAENGAVSRLLHAPNIRHFSTLSHPAYCILMQRCAAIMYCSDGPKTHALSCSTHLVQAVANGAAILGNAHTGLDAFWPSYPGEKTATTPTHTQLAAFADRALAGDFAPALQHAQDWNAAVLADTQVFGGLF